jgi:hypothetical protein
MAYCGKTRGAAQWLAVAKGSLKTACATIVAFPHYEQG